MTETIGANDKKKDFYKAAIICLILMAAVIVLYWPVREFDFVDLDDSIYVYDNPFLARGLTSENIAYAFSTTFTTNWHPLTWISLILDYELFRLNPGGYHWTNVVLHLFNTALLFLLLNLMTGQAGRSALVAFLFAVHPINVESVAWISGRKNVLSAAFWLLTMLSYFYYVKKPAIGRYFLIIAFFLMGLMTKPITVVLPFVLLLVDYWPLNRFQDSRRLFLLYEKIPLFALSAISGLITLWAASQGGAVKSLDAFPWDIRLANALLAYMKYIINLLYPVNLACFYPYSKIFPLWLVSAAAAALMAMTTFSILYARYYPYILFGWLWYLILLLPVSGLVQVGYQAMADRYAYISFLGLFVIIAWGGYDFLLKFRRVKHVVFASAIPAALILCLLSSNQIGHWRNSESLFRHAHNVTTDNFMASSGLGKVYLNNGQYEKAKSFFLESIRLNPAYAESYNNLGITYLHQNNYNDAIEQFRKALQRKSDDAKIHNNLAVALSVTSNYDEAILHFEYAILLRADYKEARENMAKTKQLRRLNEKSRTP